MNNKIQDAFSSIHATEELKHRTINNLYKQLETKKKPSRNMFMSPVVAVCSVFLVMLIGFSGYNFYTAPMSYISIDINPSIELALNRMDYVVEVEGYNEDATAVLQNLDLKNKPYTEAIELLLADENFAEYMQNDALLSFTVVSPKEEELLTGIQGCRGYSQAQSQCHSGNAQMREEARGQGISFGKYQAYLKLSQYDESITLEHCKGLSMRQIQDLIDSNTNGEDNSTSGNGGGNGMGHHGGGMGGQGNENGNHNGNGYRGGRD